MRFFNTDVVNSYALRLAGITRSTPDPDQGRIEHDADGEPNGLLRAKAKGLVRRLIPQPTADETRQALRLGCREMLRFGITSVIEPGLNSDGDPRLSVVLRRRRTHRAHQPDAELARFPPGGIRERSWTTAPASWASTRGWATSGCASARLKMAIDGGTTPHTAYMYEPFEGETEVKNYNRLDICTIFAASSGGQGSWAGMSGSTAAATTRRIFAVDAFVEPRMRGPVRSAPQHHPRLFPDRSRAGADGDAQHRRGHPADLHLLGRRSALPGCGRATGGQLQAGAQVSGPRRAPGRQLG